MKNRKEKLKEMLKKSQLSTEVKSKNVDNDINLSDDDKDFANKLFDKLLNESTNELVDGMFDKLKV